MPIVPRSKSHTFLYSLAQFLLSTFPLTLFLNCRQLDPNYSEPIIQGSLYRLENYDYSVSYERYFDIFDSRGLRMVPIIILNKETLDGNYYGTEYIYQDTNTFPVNTRYRLQVSHYWGKATAEVMMPGNFSLITPPENYILDLESTLVISWHPAPGAEWYGVELRIDYDYRNFFGEEEDYTYIFDTLVKDTSLTIPPERIFPASVADVLEGDGSAWVWAGSGPTFLPGDKGNISGAGFGFFNAINETREKYFYVGAPINIRRHPKIIRERRRMLYSTAFRG